MCHIWLYTKFRKLRFPLYIQKSGSERFANNLICSIYFMIQMQQNIFV